MFSVAFAFLKDSTFGAALGIGITVDNGAAFVATLASDGDWCKRVFGLKTR